MGGKAPSRDSRWRKKTSFWKGKYRLLGKVAKEGNRSSLWYFRNERKSVWRFDNKKGVGFPPNAPDVVISKTVSTYWSYEGELTVVL